MIIAMMPARIASGRSGPGIPVEFRCQSIFSEWNSGNSGPGRPGWFPTQAPHRSGRVEQETHLVTPPRPTSQVPIIGFSALLQLVEWYQVRLRRDQQGGSSCVDPQPPLSPPAPIRAARPLNPRQLWLGLTVESRERILGVGVHRCSSSCFAEVVAREHGHHWTTIGVSGYGPWLISTSRSLIRCSRRGCRRHQRTYFRTSRS